MPHIPRRYASTSGIQPELGLVPKQSSGRTRSSESYRSMPSSPGRQDDERGIQPTLSVRSWDVDPERIWKQMTGVEAKYDEHTREMVPA